MTEDEMKEWQKMLGILSKAPLPEDKLVPTTPSVDSPRKICTH